MLIMTMSAEWRGGPVFEPGFSTYSTCENCKQLRIVGGQIPEEIPERKASTIKEAICILFVYPQNSKPLKVCDQETICLDMCIQKYDYLKR